MVLVFAAAGLAYGFQMERFSYTVYTLGVGFVLASLVSTCPMAIFGTVAYYSDPSQLTLPPWPMYRQKPLKWQKPLSQVSASSKGKKKKN